MKDVSSSRACKRATISIMLRRAISCMLAGLLGVGGLILLGILFLPGAQPTQWRPWKCSHANAAKSLLEPLGAPRRRDQEDARPCAADAARPRRRGDRIATHFAAVHLSAFGTKRTYGDDLLFVRFWG